MKLAVLVVAGVSPAKQKNHGCERRVTVRSI
jgi:hypothetical protein